MKRKKTWNAKLTLIDDKEICRLYSTGEKNSVQLAKMYEISSPSIRQILHKYNIPMRKREQNGEKNHMYGRLSKGNPNWKGGIAYRNGYKMIHYPEHPKNQNGYVYEHRIIMEDLLNRILGNKETIHHKNGNKLDNSMENLELIIKSEHQRLHSELRERDGYGRFC